MYPGKVAQRKPSFIRFLTMEPVSDGEKEEAIVNSKAD